MDHEDPNQVVPHIDTESRTTNSRQQDLSASGDNLTYYKYIKKQLMPKEFIKEENLSKETVAEILLKLNQK